MPPGFSELANQVLTRVADSDLKAPTHIVFAPGALQQIGSLARTLTEGTRVFIVYGGKSAENTGIMERAEAYLGANGFEMARYTGIDREPTATMVDRAAADAREKRPDLVIGIGGGSVIDVAKAVAALVTNEGPVEDYLEGVGTGREVVHDPLPMLAVPTTAGTGAEVTKNSVIGSKEKGYKKSMRHERMIPDVALIDAELTVHVPPHTTAAGGMDAITQLIEPCISRRRTEATTTLALEVLEATATALPACYERMDDLEARNKVALGSVISGVCLANSGLAMAHGIASGLGAITNIPHGLACGVLLPHTLRYNRDACTEELAQALSALLGEKGSHDNIIDKGIEAIDKLMRDVVLPLDLKFMRLSDDVLEQISEKSMGNSMNGNPIEMDPQSTYAFLKTVA